MLHCVHFLVVFVDGDKKSTGILLMFQFHPHLVMHFAVSHQAMFCEFVSVSLCERLLGAASIMLQNV